MAAPSSHLSSSRGWLMLEQLGAGLKVVMPLEAMEREDGEVTDVVSRRLFARI